MSFPFSCCPLTAFDKCKIMTSEYVSRDFPPIIPFGNKLYLEVSVPRIARKRKLLAYKLCLAILQDICHSFKNMCVCMLNVFPSICRRSPNRSEPDQLFRWRGLFVGMSARHHSGLFIRHQHGAGHLEVGGMST